MKNLLLSLPKYGIRKYPVGICSVVIGLSFLGAQPVLAQEGGETGLIEVSVKAPVPKADERSQGSPILETVVDSSLTEFAIDGTLVEEPALIESANFIEETVTESHSGTLVVTPLEARAFPLAENEPVGTAAAQTQPNGSAQEIPENLIKNGDFEETGPSKGNWYYSSATSWDNPYIPKGIKKSNGSVYAYAGKLTFDAPKTYRAIVAQTLAVDPKQSYLLTGNLETFDVTGAGVKIRVTYKDQNQKDLRPQMYVATSPVTGNSNVKIEKVIPLTPETHFLKVELMFDKGTGVASFDDLSLTVYHKEESTFNKEQKEIERQPITIPTNKIYITNRPELRYVLEDTEIASVENHLIIPKQAGQTKLFIYNQDQLVSTVDFIVNPFEETVFDSILKKWEQISLDNGHYKESDAYMKRLKENQEKLVEEALADWHDPVRLEPSLFHKYPLNRSADITSIYRELETMAKVLTNPSSKYYQNRDLLDRVKEGFKWLHQHVYNESQEINGNWWDYEIGTPLSMLNTLAYLNAYFSQDEINTYTKAISKFVPDTTMIRMTTPRPVPAVGGNQTDISKVAILEGALTKNPLRIQAGVYGLTTIMDHVSSGEGFYRDGSFIDHTNVAYTGAYGNVLIDGFSRILPVIQATEFALPRDKTAIIQDWIEKAFMPILVKGELLDMTRGRSVSRAQVQSHVYAVDIIVALARIAQSSSDEEKAAINSFVKEQVLSDSFSDIFHHLNSYQDHALIQNILKDSTIQARTPKTSIAAFNNMDKFVFHQAEKDFSFAISMHSHKTQNYEDMNNENRHGWYTADGMVYLYNGDLSHYSNHYWPTVNPYRLPGVTNTIQQREDGSGETVLPSQFVGANQLGNHYATVAMDFTNWDKTLTEKKAWFVLKDKVVFLGTNLQNQSAHPVVTTIENRKLLADKDYRYFLNGQEVHLSKQELEMDFPKSFYVSNGDENQSIGYVFLQPMRITSKLVEGQGSWSEINYDQPKELHTNSFLTIEAANRQSGSNYAYVLAPNSSQEDLASILQNVEVLVQTDDLQVVYDHGEKVWGIVNYQDNAYKVDNHLTVTKKGLYTVSKKGNGYLVSYYNPLFDIQEDSEVFVTDGVSRLAKASSPELPSRIWNIRLPQLNQRQHGLGTHFDKLPDFDLDPLKQSQHGSGTQTEKAPKFDLNDLKQNQYGEGIQAEKLPSLRLVSRENEKRRVMRSKLEMREDSNKQGILPDTSGQDSIVLTSTGIILLATLGSVKSKRRKG
ncbi:polysaccharide lyase family 8 super-sandwich domain-containing protein [Streptococcus sp. NLN76]|uniref:polysaccharide lyase family 8 super-sandwich domain-containing protein n=1 Tax=Streptococcus sp. NLN76 TaxID=2822800 RepID=UPI0018AB630D|nr:polysaccharide lyase family 8 super-sandwich domain-containing protein [Streptococcus sp. NLN76]MBF8969754.1 YSIRK-type signal peptide-containing protein [Streptococcus sp. NLN76]